MQTTVTLESQIALVPRGNLRLVARCEMYRSTGTEPTTGTGTRKSRTWSTQDTLNRYSTKRAAINKTAVPNARYGSGGDLVLLEDSERAIVC
jgi:hypothetical protein